MQFFKGRSMTILPMSKFSSKSSSKHSSKLPFRHKPLALICLIFLVVNLISGLFTVQNGYAAGTVTNCAYTGAGGLQAALAGNGTVTFSCSGTITIPEITIASNVTLDASGQNVILSGNSINRLFVVNPGVQLQLKNISLNSAVSTTPLNNGGAIYNNGNLLLDSVSFNGNRSNNFTANGGAIYNNGGSVTVNNSTFANNIANGYGGAIYNNGGSLTVTASTFNSNRAFRAGAIYNYQGTLLIKKSAFNGNQATDGGAIGDDNNASLVIDETTFDNNSASNVGGAFRTSSSGESSIISNSTFTNNRSTSFGGAVVASSGSLTITGTNFTGNKSNSVGGAITASINSLVVSDSVFRNNTANNDGGAITSGGAILTNVIFDSNTSSNGNGGAVNSNSLRATNSTFTNNRELNGAGGAIFTNGLTANNITVRGNIASSTGGGISISGNLEVVNSIIDNNSTTNGSGGGIFLPINGSRATITNTTITNNTANGATSDGGGLATVAWARINGSRIEGNTAGRNGGGIFNAAISGPGPFQEINDTLIKSNISNANAVGTGGGGLFYNTTLGLSMVDSTFDDNRVTGTNADGGGAIFFGQNNSSVIITNGTFTANRVNGNAMGGAIRFNASTVARTIINSTFSDNQAGIGGATANGGGGGAIYNVNGNTLTVIGSTFNTNVAVGTTFTSTNAENGGGGAVHNQGTMTITSSTFTGNKASASGFNAGGAAIRNGTTGNLTIEGVVFDGNSSTSFGGAVRSFGNVTIKNSSFTGNNGFNCGAFDTYSGTAIINNTTFDANFTNGDSSGGIGGAMCLSGGTITLNRVTVTNSKAGTYAGAIQSLVPFTMSNSTIANNVANNGGAGGINGSGATLTNVTIAYNRAINGAGGGIYGTHTLQNSIIANNTATAPNTNNCNAPQTNNNDLQYDPAGATASGCGTIATNPPNTDPLLAAAPANNGGQTQTIALLAGSPAIDAGDATNCTGTTTATDQRFAPRTGTCDIGAYEYNSSPPNIIINPAVAPSGTAGVAYSFNFSATGSVAPYTYTLVSGNLPGGLALNAGGSITGTPTVPGTYTVTIRATSTNTGASGTITYKIVINPPAPIVISPATAPTGTIGTNYTFDITGSGGSSNTYSATITSGVLPPGLALSFFSASTSRINGTPTGTGGSYTFTIEFTDSVGSTKSSRTYTIVIQPTITISPATLPNGAVNQPYNVNITATGGLLPYSFVVSSGTFPFGLLLDANTGTITGTPTTPGSFSFTVRVTDANGFSSTQTYSNVQIYSPISINPAVLVNGRASTAYSQNLTAFGGSSGPYTFAVTSGTLPNGVTLATGGLLSGTPTAAGVYTFSVTATDANNFKGIRNYTWTIDPAQINLTPLTLPNGVVGSNYSAVITATGGVAPYSITLTSGSLPPNLTLNSATANTITLSGTPTGNGGTYTFTLTATDTNGNTGSRSYTVKIAPIITITPVSLPALPPARVGVPVSDTLTANGGVGPYTFAVTSGTLPPGLILDSATRKLFGTPTTAGTFVFIVTATDSNGFTGSASYTYVVQQALAISPPTLPNGTVGVQYNGGTAINFGASGGTAPYTFSLLTGDIPGLTLTSAGVLSGTPTIPGTYAVTVQAITNTGLTGTLNYNVTIAAGTGITISPATLPAATVGTAYSQNLTAGGGAGAPYSFALTAGALPPGVSLSNAGVVSGTPVGNGGYYSFTVTATDGNGNSGSRAYILQVTPLITLNPANLPNGKEAVAYNQNIVASGGAATFSFAVTAGTLPTGVILDSFGQLTGTPATASAGNYNFTVTATDGNGFTATRAYTLTILPAITVNPAVLPNGSENAAYTQNLSATGGTAPYTFALTSGTLPLGLTLTNGGVLSGTATNPGTFSFTITATDSTGNTGTRSYSVTIYPASLITISPPTLPDGLFGVAYSQTLTASGGSGPYVYGTITGLPPGLTFNQITRTISGTPTDPAGGFYTFTATATDSNGQVGSRTYTIAIIPNIQLGTLPATATVGTVYTGNVTVASGGTAPFSFALSGGVLPPGLGLNPAGTLTGTPALAGIYSFAITATDANGFTGTASYTITVGNALTLSPPPLPSGTVTVAYATTITASGGSGAYTFSVTNGAIPTGLTLNPATGTISGTPTVPGSYAFELTAADNANPTLIGKRFYTIVINPAPNITLAPPTLPGGQVGVAYAGPGNAVSANGGTGPYSFSITNGTLPPGLSLTAATGVISGTPTLPGSFIFTVTATDSNNFKGSQAYTIVISASLTLNPPTLPNGAVNTPYSQALSASGGANPYNFAVTAGALPNGVNLSSTGVLSGTPTATGTFNFTVTVTDGQGSTATRAYTVVISAAISITPTNLPNGALGTLYNQALTASGGSGAPYTFAILTGALPGGLTLSNAGVINGTPTASGIFSFTVTATDSTGGSGSQSYTIRIGATITLTPATLPNGKVGTAYNQTITAGGGTSPYSLSVSSGALPPGLNLTAAGVLAGTPTLNGAFSFVVTASDANSFSGSQAYTVVIDEALTLAPTGLPNGKVGISYPGGAPSTIVATGGSAPYTYALASGNIPGLTLNSATGLISGKPTVAGTFALRITATDNGGLKGQRDYSVTIDPDPGIAINPATLPNGAVGLAYNGGTAVNLSAVNGTAPYTFAVTDGALPGGLSLSAAGALSGTPTASGTFVFTITATDAGGFKGSRAYTIVIAPIITISPNTLPNGAAGTAYNQTVSASGGATPYLFAVISGILPPGLNLNTTSGVLNGTPTVAGAYNFVVQARDTNNFVASQSYSVTINPAITLNPATLPDGTVGVVYPTTSTPNITLTATGGTGPYKFNISSGSLPGLSLNPTTGVLSGTPTLAGTFNFTVTVTDSTAPTPLSGTRNYTILINPAPGIAVNPSTLPNGTIGAAYSGGTLTASGGTAPYSFAVTDGVLPSGLTLAANGGLSGTPVTNSGTFNFTITASDSNGAKGSRAYSIIVKPVITLSPATLPKATVGAVYNQKISGSGGTAPYLYNVSSGNLPPGLAFNFLTGTLSGTPTTAGSYNFTLSASDNNGFSGTLAYSLDVDGALAVNPSSLPAGAVGVNYNQTLTVSGGTAPYSFAITAGSVTGLNLSSAGVLSGKPTTAGTFSFTITATDSNGLTGTRLYTLTITAPSPVFAADPVIGSTINIATTVGTDASTTITVKNPSNSALNVSVPGVSGTNAANFVVTPTAAFSLADSTATPQTITVKCVATAATTYTAILTYTTNDPTNPLVTFNLNCVVKPAPDVSYFHPLSPSRLYDSRATGTSSSNPPLGVGAGIFAAGEVRTVKAVGFFNIPANATAILANITVTEAENGGYLAAFPANLPDINTAAVNWYNSPKGFGPRTVANFTVIGLSPSGEFKLKVSGRTNVVVDVVGYLDNNATNASTFKTATGTSLRMYDSRPAGTNPVAPPLGVGSGRLLNGQTRTVPIGGQLGVPANATAVIINVTAVNTQKGGFFSLYPTSATAPSPLISSLNWQDASNSGANIPRDVSNLAVVPLNNGQFNIVAGGNDPTAGADLIIDVVGYFEQSTAPTGSFQVLFSSLLRLYDSRPDQLSYPGNFEKTPLAPQQTRIIKAAGLLGVPANAKAVIIRITAVDVVGGGFLTAYPGPVYPGTSTINTTAAYQQISNLAIVTLDKDGNFLIRNGHPANSFGFVIDILGYIS